MSTGKYVAEPAMQAAQNYRERNRGIPVEAEVAFTDHWGQRNPKCEQRQKKLLAKLSFIRPYLDEDESVVLVTTACSPFSLLEQFLGGWIIVLLKRSLLVFTNKRFFHVPTTADYSFRRSIAVVDYSWCQKIQVRGGALKVRYHNGKQEQFTCLDGRERKKLKSMFQDTPLPQPEAMPLQRTFLCPNCGVALSRVVQPCQHCGQQFRDRVTANLLSVLVPGGGYFYTGHPVLGVLDALVETYLTLCVFFSAFGALTGSAEASMGFIVFGIVLALEKAVTIYESNHFLQEFLPKGAGSPYTQAKPVQEQAPVAVAADAQENTESVLRAGAAL